MWPGTSWRPSRRPSSSTPTSRRRPPDPGRAGSCPRDLRVVADGGPALLLSYSLCITSMRFVVPGERRSGPRPLGSAPRRPRDDPARGAPRPGHRHRASRPQGPGAHRVRPRVDEPEPPARLSDRPRARPAAARSRTSTATSSSTSPPASPSTRPATAIPTSSPRSSARPRPAPALQRERLLPADLRPGCRGAGPDRPDVGADARVHRQLRRRGGRGRDQARPVRHRAAERRRVPGRRSTAGR